MYNKNLIGWITLLAIVASENGVTGRRDLFQKEGKARQNSWKLLWQDEFEFFDRSKWEYQYEDGCGYGICRWGNNEESWYTEKNVQVKNGLLQIEAKEELGGSLRTIQQSCWDYCGYLCYKKGLIGDILDGCVKDCGGHRCPKARFTSGRIRTFGKFSISPSEQYRTIRVEARINLTSSEGIWPAFWMLPEEGAKASCSGCGKYGNWPASGEIDIMETHGQMDSVNGTLHFGGDKSHAYTTFEVKSSPGFHVYGIEWQDDTMRWYMDGNQYGEAFRASHMRPGWFTPSSSTGPFDVNFHILLNLAVGGSYTGLTQPDMISRALKSTTNVMEVDYVRVYGK